MNAKIFGRLASIVAIVGISTQGYAATLPVVEGAVPAPSQMKPGTIYYSYKTLKYDDWQNGTEKTVLNLFPDFRSPTPAKAQKLVLYIAKTSAVVNKPVSQVDLSQLKKLDRIQKLQADLAELTPLAGSDVWTRKETFLSYRNPKKGPGWCQDSADLCLSSKFVFDDLAGTMVASAWVLQGKLPEDLTAQSQVKLEKAGSIAQGAELKALIGLPTDPQMVLTDDMFMFNHVIEFGKVIGVTQAHPDDPNKTIVTSYTVFAVEEKWWNFGIRGTTLEQAFLGKRWNRPAGLAMGLPKMTQSLFSTLLGEL